MSASPGVEEESLRRMHRLTQRPDYAHQTFVSAASSSDFPSARPAWLVPHYEQWRSFRRRCWTWWGRLEERGVKRDVVAGLLLLSGLGAYEALILTRRPAPLRLVIKYALGNVFPSFCFRTKPIERVAEALALDPQMCLRMLQSPGAKSLHAASASLGKNSKAVNNAVSGRGASSTSPSSALFGARPGAGKASRSSPPSSGPPGEFLKGGLDKDVLAKERTADARRWLSAENARCLRYVLAVSLAVLQGTRAYSAAVEVNNEYQERVTRGAEPMLRGTKERVVRVTSAVAPATSFALQRYGRHVVPAIVADRASAPSLRVSPMRLWLPAGDSSHKTLLTSSAPFYWWVNRSCVGYEESWDRMGMTKRWLIPARPSRSSDKEDRERGGSTIRSGESLYKDEERVRRERDVDGAHGERGGGREEGKQGGREGERQRGVQMTEEGMVSSEVSSEGSQKSGPTSPENAFLIEVDCSYPILRSWFGPPTEEQRRQREGVLEHIIRWLQWALSVASDSDPTDERPRSAHTPQGQVLEHLGASEACLAVSSLRSAVLSHRGMAKESKRVVAVAVGELRGDDHGIKLAADPQLDVVIDAEALVARELVRWAEVARESVLERASGVQAAAEAKIAEMTERGRPGDAQEGGDTGDSREKSSGHTTDTGDSSDESSDNTRGAIPTRDTLSTSAMVAPRPRIAQTHLARLRRGGGGGGGASAELSVHGPTASDRLERVLVVHSDSADTVSAIDRSVSRFGWRAVWSRRRWSGSGEEQRRIRAGFQLGLHLVAVADEAEALRQVQALAKKTWGAPVDACEKEAAGRRGRGHRGGAARPRQQGGAEHLAVLLHSDRGLRQFLRARSEGAMGRQGPPVPWVGSSTSSSSSDRGSSSSSTSSGSDSGTGSTSSDSRSADEHSIVRAANHSRSPAASVLPSGRQDTSVSRAGGVSEALHAIPSDSRRNEAGGHDGPVRGVGVGGVGGGTFGENNHDLQRHMHEWLREGSELEAATASSAQRGSLTAICTPELVDRAFLGVRRKLRRGWTPQQVQEQVDSKLATPQRPLGRATALETAQGRTRPDMFSVLPE